MEKIKQGSGAGLLALGHLSHSHSVTFPIHLMETNMKDALEVSYI